jgi:ASTRA-associated protein 1
MHRKEPWLLHSLQINTLNFCSFAMCAGLTPTLLSPQQPQQPPTSNPPESQTPSPILIATVSPKDNQIDIFQLPSEKRLYRSAAPSGSSLAQDKIGMVMCVRIFYLSGRLHLITGHESGLCCVQVLVDPDPAPGNWRTLYLSRPHTQPMLSLDVCPDLQKFWTSGADAVIAEHRVEGAMRSGQAEQPVAEETPEAILGTKHSGQQSLVVRSDGKILATAGWDGRVRVYATKRLKELAVLKWHKEGCYAVAFAEILDGGEDSNGGNHRDNKAGDGEGRGSKALVESSQTVRQRREAKTQNTHLVAAGSKDGKISLWDIY